MAELMPVDYSPSRTQRGTHGESRELAVAVALAITEPGRWVRVGAARYLAKPPTSWVSEVNRGDKVILREAGGTWQASYESTGETDGLGRQGFIKLLRHQVGA